MNTHTTPIGSQQAKYTLYSGTNAESVQAPITFMAANGFSVGSYDYFLAPLTKHNDVYALEHRALWTPYESPTRGENWADQKTYLINFIEAVVQRPVHAVGHSLGAAISLFAALERPDLFESVTMIEQATVPQRIHILLQKMLPSDLRDQLVPVIRKTLDRTNEWQSKEDFIDYLKARSAYRGFSEEALNAYADSGLIADTDGKFRLAYAVEWEAHNFRAAHAHTIDWVNKLTLPTMVIRAQYSKLCMKKPFEQAKRRAKIFNKKDHHFVEIANTSHLLIQQDHQAVLDVVDAWLGRFY